MDIKNKESLVTIAIPIYNADFYLSFAIQSVINQTYQNWELLLMEDGSTDSSLEIARQYAEKDERIRVIKDGVNRGLIYRLNESIKMANGKYYARMDADDIMTVDRIEKELLYLQEHPEVDVVSSSIMTIDNKSNIIGSGYNFGKVASFIHPTVMGKTEWFRANPYAEWALRAEDFELWTRTCSKSCFHAIGKPLLFYREFGVPTFRKYNLSQKTIIRIAAHYHEYGKPYTWYVKTICLSYLKMVVNVLLSVIGKTDILVAIRRRKSVPEELLLTKKDLCKAVQQHL